MKITTSKKENILTAIVKMEKLEEGQKPRKVDSLTVLLELRDKYDILGYHKRNTIISSHDGEVEGEFQFVLAEEKKVKKTTRRSSGKNDEK